MQRTAPAAWSGFGTKPRSEIGSSRTRKCILRQHSISRRNRSLLNSPQSLLFNERIRALNGDHAFRLQLLGRFSFFYRCSFLPLEIANQFGDAVRLRTNVFRVIVAEELGHASRL